MTMSGLCSSDRTQQHRSVTEPTNLHYSDFLSCFSNIAAEEDVMKIRAAEERPGPPEA